MKAVVSTIFECEEMKSDKHVSQHEILGRPMVEYAVQAARDAGFETGVAEDDGAIERLIKLDSHEPGGFLILAANAPLITGKTLSGLVDFHAKSQNQISWIPCDTAEETPCRSAVAVIASAGFLHEGLMRLSGIDCNKGEKCRQSAMTVFDASETIRVSDRIRLSEAIAIMRERINYLHMKNGVTILDPKRTDIGPDVTIGRDTVIYPGCYFENGTKIGDNCVIGPDSKINGAEIADFAEVSYSVILDSKVGRGTTVGPFAYIRPHSVIGEKCKIGDFVEIKNSSIGDGTKASHLTYVGDSDVGRGVNFGCGTVTVNYDGVGKHRTVINDNAFIGCNTNLVAPVEVGENAYTAAGSTIVSNVARDSLAIARSHQVNKPEWTARRNGKINS